MLDSLIPGKKISEDSIRESYLSFERELFKKENRGEFESINPEDTDQVISAFKNELSCDFYQALAEQDLLRYQNVLFGIRQYRRYVFCVDSRNSLNKEIQKSIKCPLIKLEFDDKSFIFYLILNCYDLDSFLTAFFRWLIIVSEPVE